MQNQNNNKVKNKLEVNRRVNRMWNIRKVIKENCACLICIKRLKGEVKKYKTNC